MVTVPLSNAVSVNLPRKRTPKLNLDEDALYDLHNLLCQLNWLNTSMESDRSNEVINTLIQSIDSTNKTEMCELLQTITRINLSTGLIQNTLKEFENIGII